MSDTNLSYLYIPSEIQTFAITYYVLGSIFIVFACIYMALTLKTTCEEKDETQGQFNAQIAYIAAVICKGIGLIVSGIFLTVKTPTAEDHSFNDRYSVLPGGIPGYVSAIAYCFIFFSWCSVCFDCFEKNATKFYSRSKWVLTSLISIVVLLFAISFICMLSVSAAKFHRVEQGVAITRDLILALMFAIYLYKIYKLFEDPCPGCGQPESKLFFICITLIVSLVMRPISIAIYSLWIYPPGKAERKSEFSPSYFVIFLVEFLLTELIPLGSIGYTRLIGTLSSNEVSNELSTFMAFV